MARLLPPPPIKEDLPTPFRDWLNKLYTFLGDTTNLILWNQIDTSGSELDDISIRPHSQLQAVSGSSEQYHVASTQYTELIRAPIVTSVAVDTSLTDSHNTVLVTVTGKTMTLPAASTTRIGRTWTIVQAVDGYVQIQAAGADTINIVNGNTAIRTTVKGAGVTFRCTSASSWSIV